MVVCTGFWQRYKEGTHFLLGAFGQSVFAGVFATVFWLAISCGGQVRQSGCGRAQIQLPGGQRRVI